MARTPALMALDRSRRRLRAAAVRLTWAGAFAAAAAASALGGFGFFVAALYSHLAGRLAPPGAALAVGGLLLIVAAVLSLVAGRVLGRGRRAAGPPADTADFDADRWAAGLGQSVGEETVRWAKAHPYGAFAVALLAGVAVGANSRPRRR